MSGILTVKGLKKNYGSRAVLKDLSFHIEKGEIFGLLGHNGSGKSTTIDCILGMKKYEGGEVRLLGNTTKKIDKAVFEKIGVQFQQSHYPDKIKVGELCDLTSSYYTEPADWKPLLQSFGLGGKEKILVEKLSGGEKQKLSVLLTLFPNPEMVFLDELTTGLDTLARRQVWREIRGLKEKGVTVLLTSHYMDEVEILCDRIGIIAEGKIAVLGTIKEVIEKSGKGTLEEAYLWYTGREAYENFL